MIRELTVNEVEDVSGGILPIVGFALAVAARVGVGVTTTNVVGHVGAGASLGIATYSFCNYLGGGGSAA